ncbi:MAG: cytochrome c oxidase assembly protein, partial [Gammaproteobacteria bacterium]
MTKNSFQRGKITLPVLFLVPVVMFGFGYLMVPIYNVFCEITGLNGKTGVISSSEASQLSVVKERLVKVEFTGSLNMYAPWQFKPEVTSMMVHPGQQYRTNYIATNRLDKSLVGQA